MSVKESTSPEIIYFYNNSDHPISFDYKGGRYTLWSPQEVFKDREGNPITDPALDHENMRGIGLCPKYALTQSKKIDKPAEASPVYTDEQLKCVRANGSDIWVFNLDNHEESQVPKMKQYILEKYGKSVMDRISFDDTI